MNDVSNNPTKDEDIALPPPPFQYYTPNHTDNQYSLVQLVQSPDEL